MPVEISTETAKEKKAQEKRQQLDENARRAAELLNPGESVNATDFRELVAVNLGVSNKSRVESILHTCIDQKILVTRPPTAEEKKSPATRVMIERPKIPLTQGTFQFPQSWGD